MTKAIRRLVGLAVLVVFLSPVSGKGLNAAPLIEIRTAAQDSAPKFLNNADGTVGGLCVDIMRAIEKTDPRIKFVGTSNFLPFRRIESRLSTGNIDVFFGFSRNPERESQFRFVDIPLYKVNYLMAVRKDDPGKATSFDDIRALGQGAIVMALFGTADVDYLRAQGGLSVDDSAKSPETMLERLISGRGRFAYYHELGLVHTIRHNKLEQSVRLLPQPFKAESAHYAAFSLHASQEKVVAVERALKKLRESGDLQDILKRYQLR